jgi:hypothetical protein
VILADKEKSNVIVYSLVKAVILAIYAALTTTRSRREVLREAPQAMLS